MVLLGFLGWTYFRGKIPRTTGAGQTLTLVTMTVRVPAGLRLQTNPSYYGDLLRDGRGSEQTGRLSGRVSGRALPLGKSDQAIRLSQPGYPHGMLLLEDVGRWKEPSDEVSFGAFRLDLTRHFPIVGEAQPASFPVGSAIARGLRWQTTQNREIRAGVLWTPARTYFALLVSPRRPIHQKNRFGRKS